MYDPLGIYNFKVRDLTIYNSPSMAIVPFAPNDSKGIQLLNLRGVGADVREIKGKSDRADVREIKGKSDRNEVLEGIKLERFKGETVEKRCK